MLEYRITKYNPLNRNSEGHYLIDEWTCPSEKGKIFNGVEFGEKEYFEVESKYISAIIEILKSKSISHLRVIDLCINFTDEYLAEKDNQWLVCDSFHEIDLFEDKSINYLEIETVIKMILRNFIGCRLGIDGKFILRFGHDYYMYACCSKCKPEIIDKINRLGVFVEEGSPCDIDRCEFSIQIVKKNDEDGIIDEEIFLERMSRDKIKQGLNLSQEHTGNHSFQITAENSGIFSGELEFNFNENEYYLYCDQNYC